MLGASASAYCQQTLDNTLPLPRSEKAVQTPSSPPPSQTSAQDGDLTFIQAQAPRKFAAPVWDAPYDTGLFARPDSSMDVRLNNGHILLPYVRYDLSRQGTTTHGYATANRLEVGAGHIALSFENYMIAQHGANNAVRVDHQMLLFRELVYKFIEVDLGFGQTVISAAQRTNVFSMSGSARVALPFHLAAELRTTFPVANLWYQDHANGPGNFFDMEAAVHAYTRFGSLKIGYRVLNANYDSANWRYLTDQSGVFVGFSLYY